MHCWWFILNFIIGGMVEGQRVFQPPQNCPHFVKFFCRCDSTQDPVLKPVKMCVYTSKNKGEACLPCPNHLQEFVSCSSCLRDTCPICSPEDFRMPRQYADRFTDGSAIPSEQIFFTFSEKNDDIYYVPPFEVYNSQSQPINALPFNHDPNKYLSIYNTDQRVRANIGEGNYEYPLLSDNQYAGKNPEYQDNPYAQGNPDYELLQDNLYAQGNPDYQSLPDNQYARANFRYRIVPNNHYAHGNHEYHAERVQTAKRQKPADRRMVNETVVNDPYIAEENSHLTKQEQVGKNDKLESYSKSRKLKKYDPDSEKKTQEIMSIHRTKKASDSSVNKTQTMTGDFSLKNGKYNFNLMSFGAKAIGTNKTNPKMDITSSNNTDLANDTKSSSKEGNTSSANHESLLNDDDLDIITFSYRDDSPRKMNNTDSSRQKRALKENMSINKVESRLSKREFGDVKSIGTDEEFSNKEDNASSANHESLMNDDDLDHIITFSYAADYPKKMNNTGSSRQKRALKANMSSIKVESGLNIREFGDVKSIGTDEESQEKETTARVDSVADSQKLGLNDENSSFKKIKRSKADKSSVGDQKQTQSKNRDESFLKHTYDIQNSNPASNLKPDMHSSAVRRFVFDKMGNEEISSDGSSFANNAKIESDTSFSRNENLAFNKRFREGVKRFLKGNEELMIDLTALSSGNKKNKLNTKRSTKLYENDYSKMINDLISMKISQNLNDKSLEIFDNERLGANKLKRHTYPMEVLVMEAEVGENLEESKKKSRIERLFQNSFSKPSKSDIRKQSNSFSDEIGADNDLPINYNLYDYQNFETLIKKDRNKCFVDKINNSYWSVKNKYLGKYMFRCVMLEKDETRSTLTSLITNKINPKDVSITLGITELFPIVQDLTACLLNKEEKNYILFLNEQRVDFSNCPFTFLPEFVAKFVETMNSLKTENNSTQQKEVIKTVTIKQNLYPDIELQVIMDLNYLELTYSKMLLYDVVGSLNVEVNMRLLHPKSVTSVSQGDMKVPKEKFGFFPMMTLIVADKHSMQPKPKIILPIHFIPLSVLSPSKRKANKNILTSIKMSSPHSNTAKINQAKTGFDMRNDNIKLKPNVSFFKLSDFSFGGTSMDNSDEVSKKNKFLFEPKYDYEDFIIFQEGRKPEKYDNEKNKKDKNILSRKMSDPVEQIKKKIEKKESSLFDDPFHFAFPDPFGLPFEDKWIVVDKIKNDSRSYVNRKNNSTTGTKNSRGYYLPIFEPEKQRKNEMDLFLNIMLLNGINSSISQNKTTSSYDKLLLVVEPQKNFGNITQMKINATNKSDELLNPFKNEKEMDTIPTILEQPMKKNYSVIKEQNVEFLKKLDNDLLMHDSELINFKNGIIDPNLTFQQIEDEVTILGSNQQSHDIDFKDDDLFPANDFKKYSQDINDFGDEIFSNDDFQKDANDGPTSASQVKDNRTDDSDDSIYYDEYERIENFENNSKLKLNAAEGNKNMPLPPKNLLTEIQNFENETENEVENGKPFRTRNLLISNDGKVNNEELGVSYVISDNSEDDENSRNKRELPHNDWCEIPNNQRHGTLECTFWTYQKHCNVRCHSGWIKSGKEKESEPEYNCTRKLNKWAPGDIQACIPGPDNKDAYADEKDDDSEGNDIDDYGGHDDFDDEDDERDNENSVEDDDDSDKYDDEDYSDDEDYGKEK